MMTAVQAAKETEVAKKRLARQETANRKKREAEHRKQLAWERRTTVPAVLKGVDKAVQEGIKAGFKASRYYHNSEPEWATQEIIRKKLEAKGFTVSISTRHWEGDSESPGGSAIDVMVSWEKPSKKPVFGRVEPDYR